MEGLQLQERHNSGVPLCLMYEVVAFPGVAMGLEVEHPAYKLMMRRAWQGSKIVGLIPMLRSADGSAPQQPGRIGCELELKRITAAGNKLVVEAVGRRRFALTGGADVFDGYLLGRVSYVDDMPPRTQCLEVMLTQRIAEVRALMRNIGAQIQRSECPVGRKMFGNTVQCLPEDDSELSFYLAGRLPVPADVKLQWLETQCPVTRLDGVLTHLRVFNQKICC
eukprot:TRINITY_DN1930_c1_g1_i2.p2 TRINITY_DN1930_c1_g1~~TRINITY_DN1930_c1_g1_i2.p2  ORF type:complete len:222 (+),score=41.80 TRINITY_DN1930_c1_g1_i2:802-1467(+)